MSLLGSAVDFNGPQIFIVGDPAVVRGWRGTTNGVGEGAEGSDWERAFNEIYDTGSDETHWLQLDTEAGPLQLFAFGIAGWKLVYSIEGRIVIVDGCFDDKTESEVESEAGDTESVPSQASFADYVASPVNPNARRVSEIETSSQWLVVMSTVAAYSELGDGEAPDVSDLSSRPRTALQLDDEPGGQALFIPTQAQRYSAWVEPKVEAEWGSAERLLLVPCE